MAFTIKDYNDIVEDIIDRLKSADIGFSDNNGRTIIQTIIEAVAVELDISYEKLQYIYDSLLIDNAVGYELDRLVSIFNVIRKPATTSTGVVTFGRSSPATFDILIPTGTIVSTNTDINGDTYEFTTVGDVTLLTGESHVDANVVAIVEGYIDLAVGQVSVMNEAIIGIEEVNNGNPIVGGTDIEDDVTLRERAKETLSGLGKGTSSAIVSVVKAITGIADANMLDMNRGVGTADLVVVGSTIPIDSGLLAEVQQAVADTKAAGIDVGIIEPTVIVQNVEVSVQLADGYSIDTQRASVGWAISAYFATLKVGSPFVIHQLNKYILSNSAVLAQNEGIVVDVTNITPSANVAATSLQIIRMGAITINGVVW